MDYIEPHTPDIEDADLTREDAIVRLVILRRRIAELRTYADGKFGETQLAWDAVSNIMLKNSDLTRELNDLRRTLDSERNVLRRAKN